MIVTISIDVCLPNVNNSLNNLKSNLNFYVTSEMQLLLLTIE